MHNHGIFAIPGLMPPKAANWRSRLIAPEDGSLKLLVHCGKGSDEVHYTITIPGHRRGIIKDPTYEFENHDLEDWDTVVPTEAQKEKWPNFLREATELTDDILIPRIKIHGCPILLTELCEDCEEPDQFGKPPSGPSTGMEPPSFEGDATGRPHKHYFILDCPPRTLPVGDSTVAVVINEKLRRYIVQRPDFNIHHRGGVTMRYRKFKKD